MPAFVPPDRPVLGVDPAVDRSQGWVDPRVEESGHVRIGVYGEDGGILGYVNLTLIEFVKIVSLVRKDAYKLFGSKAEEGLSW